MQTMQQKRAKYALSRVKDMAKNDDKGEKKTNHSEYKSYASALPAMIQMNGLGQAAAFYKSKGGTHEQLYVLLSNWLCGRNEIANETQPFQAYSNLLEGITESDIYRYRLAQAEAQALMDWVKKFAKAYMPDEQENKDNATTV